MGEVVHVSAENFEHMNDRDCLRFYLFSFTSHATFHFLFFPIIILLSIGTGQIRANPDLSNLCLLNYLMRVFFWVDESLIITNTRR